MKDSILEADSAFCRTDETILHNKAQNFNIIFIYSLCTT